MAGERTLPGLGLTGFWNLGDDTWKAGMDVNLRVLSALVQARALSVISADPGAPVNGDVYLTSSTHPTQPNKVALRDNGAWVYLTPLVGWRIYNIATGNFFVFNGTTWAQESVGLTAEDVRDVIGSAIVSGTNVNVTVNDGADTITIASTDATTDEQIQDVVGALIGAGANVTVTYNDASNTLTIASAGGGGTSTTTHYSSFGLVVGMVTVTFATTGAPSYFAQSAGAALTTVDDATDAGYTKALTFNNGNAVGGNSQPYFDVPVYADATNKTVTIRYRTQGEGGYDGLKIFLDGVQVVDNRAGDSGWTVYTVDLTAGAHTLRFQYSSDNSINSGYENARFTSMVFPRQVAGVVYKHGDTVDNGGYRWLCLVAGTNQTPADGATDWQRLIKTDFSVAPTAGQALIWDAVNSVWKPGTVAAGGGGSTSVVLMKDGRLYAPPLAASFPNVTNAPALYDDPDAGLLPGAVSNAGLTRWATRTMSGTNFSMTARIRLASYDNYNSIGIGMSNGARTTTLTCFMLWNNGTSFEAGTSAGTLGNFDPKEPELFARINYNLTTGAYSIDISRDGKLWQTNVWTGTLAGMTEAGICINSRNAGQPVRGQILYYADTTLAATAPSVTGAAPISARYWRLRGLSARVSNDTSPIGMSEVVFKDAAGVTISTGGTPISSSNYDGTHTAAQAFDGSSSTTWYSLSGRAFNEWIGYDFGTTKALASFTITPDQGYNGGWPLDFALDFSTDGIAWQNHTTYRSPVWTAAAQTFIVPSLVSAPLPAPAQTERTRAKPLAANLTLMNGGTGSITDGTYGLNFKAPSSNGVGIMIARITAALAATFSAIVRSQSLQMRNNPGYSSAIAVRNNTSGKIMIFGVYDNGILIQRWTSYTAFASSVVVAAGTEGTPPWKKITVDAANISFHHSWDGADWFQVHSETLANFIGSVDHVGPALFPATTMDLQDTVQSFEII